MSEAKPSKNTSSSRRLGLWIGLSVACVALLVADLVIHKHGYFGFDEWFGFYAGAGLIATLGITVLGWIFRFPLTRAEDYYDA